MTRRLTTSAHRRKLFSAVWMMLGVAFAARGSLGQGWQSTGGPLSGEVTAAAVTAEGRVLAGTAGKGLFYRSLSQGSWTRSASTAFDGITIRSIIATENDLVAATSGRGIWESTDGGETWSGLNAGLGSQIVHTLELTANGRIYAGASDGLYVLSDSDSWIRRGGGADGHDIRAIAENSSGALFAGSYGRGVLRSTDSGLSWELLQDGLATTIIRSLAVDDQDRVYVGTFGGNVVQRSDDNGETWTPSGDGLDAQGIWSIAIAPNGTFFAGARSEGIFSSSDGETWRHLSAPITTVSGFAFLGNRVWAATRVGLLRSDDDGVDWTLVGIPFSRVNTLHEIGGRILAGLHLGGVHYSDDNGFTWHPSKLDNEAVLRFAEDSQGNVLAGTLGSGLHRSEDRGETWRQIWDTPHVVYSVDVDFNDAILAGTDSGVYTFQTVDSTWQLISQPGIAIRSIIATSSGVLLAGSERESIWRSADGGQHWTQVAEQLVDNDLWIWDLIELPDGRIAAATTGQGIWTSADQGLTWQPLPGTGDVVVADLTLSPEGDLFAAGLLGQIFCAAPGAEQAEKCGDPFLSTPVRALLVVGYYTLFIGTEPLGVYRLETIADAVSDSGPGRASLPRLDLYPNPAARTATIRLRLDRPARVLWEITDVLGRTREFGQSDRTVIGEWETPIDTSRLTPGLYWIRVRDGGPPLVKSLVVM